METSSSLLEIFTGAFRHYLDFCAHELTHPSWDNVFYAVPAVCILTFLLEIFLPHKQAYPLVRRKGFWLDLFYVFFMDFMLSAIGLFALLTVVEAVFLGSMTSLGFQNPRLFDMSSLPVPAQWLILFILTDFFQYLAHWLLHRFNFLWQFHKIHHAQETLGFASTRHFHFFERFVFSTLVYIPVGLIGFSAASYFIFHLWSNLIFGFFSHCNVKIRWGFLSYLFINPDTHYWHHAKGAGHTGYGVNFASILPLWDLLFGTFYLPPKSAAQTEPELGIHRNDVPDSFIGQFLYPFRALLPKKKPAPAPAKKRPPGAPPGKRKSPRRKQRR